MKKRATGSAAKIPQSARRPLLLRYDYTLYFMANTLHKVERLDKKKIIEKMFAGGSRSFSVFPLRVVYLP